MRHFEFSEDGSSKFWEIEQSGSVLHVRWGKIGTAGQSQEKSFADDAAAAKELSKLIAEKTKKGYAEIGSGTAANAPSATTVIAPAVAPVAASAPTSKPAPRAKASGNAWKSFSPNGSFFAVAPSGNFIVVGDIAVPADGTHRMAITIHRKNGETITAPIAGTAGGIAVLPDERIVVTIARTYIPGSSTKNYDEAGIALLDANGTSLGRIADPMFAGAGTIAVDPTGKRIAFRAMPRETDHPRYLQNQLFCIDVESIVKPGVTTKPIEFGTAAPIFAFAEDGTLFAMGTGKSLSIDAAGAVHEHAAFAGAWSAETTRFNHLGLSVANGRHAAIALLDEVIVRDGGEVRFQLPVNVCTRALLVEGGKTLLTVAEAVKKRMGRAGEASVQWPDAEPLLREDNIAIWDVETGKLRKALPRASGGVYAVHAVPDQFVAIYTLANKSKVEFIEWDKLFA